MCRETFLFIKHDNYTSADQPDQQMIKAHIEATSEPINDGAKQPDPRQ